MQEVFQLVRVFDKPKEAKGNQAFVLFNESKLNLSPKQLASIKDRNIYNKSITTCFVSPEEDEHYRVNCFNAESAIQCCGHGLIAAAKTVFVNTGLSKITINENISASYNIDEMGEHVVVLSLPRLLAIPQERPSWVDKIVVSQGEKLLPSKAAISDQEDGYLLLEFKPEISLLEFRNMTLNVKHVCDNTQRAIVLVQYDQANEHLYTRYFAPQYGVEEDSATGSVMRFVGDYIEKNYHVKHFDVTQCSAQGGFMRIECKDESILITANARLEAVKC